MGDFRFLFCGIVTATLLATNVGCSSSSGGGGGGGGGAADCSGVIDATLQGDDGGCGLLDEPFVTATTTGCTTTEDDVEWSCVNNSCTGTATISQQNVATTSTIQTTFKCNGTDWTATFDPSDKVTFDGKDSHKSVTITYTAP